MLDEYTQSTHELLDTVEDFLYAFTMGIGDSNLIGFFVKFVNLIHDIGARMKRMKSILVIIR